MKQRARASDFIPKNRSRSHKTFLFLAVIGLVWLLANRMSLGEDAAAVLIALSPLEELPPSVLSDGGVPVFDAGVQDATVKIQDSEVISNTSANKGA